MSAGIHPSELTGQHFIAGTRSQDSALTFNGQNPRTGEVLAPGYSDASSKEIDAALVAAEAAAPALKYDDTRRSSLLERIAENMEALGDTLLDRAESETALAKARLEGERGRTVQQLRLFAALVKNGSHHAVQREPGDPHRKPGPKPDLVRTLLPIGPVVVFGASNFPFAYSVAGGDTASALAAGCPVVVKAHPNHPGTSELVAIAVEEAVQALGLPSGTFSMLHGQRPETALAVVRHPATRAVGFTGSLRAGRALFDAASQRPSPIPVFAEMGSVNPVFLLPEAVAARGEEIARGLHASFTLGVGQFCTNPGLVFFLRDAETDRFLGALANKVRATPAGTLLHAGIHSSYTAGCDALRTLEGVTLLASGGEASGACEAQAQAWLAPYATYARHPRLHEEVFGPSTVLVACDNRTELLRAASRLEGQLTATVHAAPSEYANFADLLSILENKAGRVVFNGFPTGVEVCSAMQHGGPYPASTDARFTSVGDFAIARFLRPVCYQGFPEALLGVRLP